MSNTTYDSHWRVLKIVELMSQKLHYNLSSQLEQTKKNKQQNSVLKNILNNIDCQSNQSLQTVADQQNDYVCKDHQNFTHLQQQYEDTISQYTFRLSQYEQEITLFRSNNQDLQNYINNQENEEKWLRDQISRLDQTIASKDKEIASFVKVVQKKKEYEGLVIKASQEMRRKEEECEEKNVIINKAQQVIVRLNEEMEKRQRQQEVEKESQMAQMRQEIENCQLSYNRIIGDFKQLEFQFGQKELELKDQQSQYEERLQTVQRKAEEIIKFFKSEAQKACQQNTISKSQSQNLFSNEKQNSVRKSKSQVRFSHQQEDVSTTPIKKNNSKATVLDTTPKSKKSRFESSHKKTAQFTQDYSSSSTPCLQLAMDAYESTLLSLGDIRSQIQLLCKDFIKKIVNKTETGKDLMKEYSDKIEQALNKEKNLHKVIENKDKLIRDIRDINIQLKYALEEQRNHYQQSLQQLIQKEELYKLIESQNKDFIDDLKKNFFLSLQNTTQNQDNLLQDFLKEKSMLIKKLDFQESNLNQLQQQLQDESNKNGDLEQDIEKLYHQLDDEIQQRSFVQYQLDQFNGHVKDIWQNQCEALASTQQFGQTNCELKDTVQVWLSDIKEQLKSQKQMNEMQKEECYQLLQQISEQNEMQQQLLISTQGFGLQNNFGASDTDCSSTNPSAFSLLRNGQFNSAKNTSQFSRNNHNQALNTQQSKRNELYNMLREEIRRMQGELNQRSDHIIALKKQIEKNDKSYRHKCDEVDQLIKDNSEIMVKRDLYRMENEQMKDQVDGLQELMKEKDSHMEELRGQVEAFGRDVELLQGQMQDIMQENYELNQEKNDWENGYQELEARLQETNDDKQQIIESYQEREESFKVKIMKYKNKINQKESSIYDLRLQLEQDVKQFQAIQDELHSKEKVMVPAITQTDPDPEQIALIQENYILQSEVNQVKNDITIVLNSYDVVKQENQKLNEQIEKLEKQVKRVEDEKSQCEKVLEQEREFIQRIKKVEKSYSNIILGVSTNDGTNRYPVFDYQDDQSESVNDQDIQQIQTDLGRMRRQSQSQGRLQRNQTSGMIHNDHQQDYQTENNQVHQQYHQFNNNYKTQQSFYAQQYDTRNAESAHTIIPSREPQMILSHNTSLSSQVQLISQRPGSAFDYNHNNKEKENRKNQQNITQLQPQVSMSSKELKQQVKQKLKKRLRHFEAILDYLQLQLQNKKKNGIEKPPTMNRNQSVGRVSGGGKKQCEEVSFYQAQSFFYHQSQSIYKKVQSMLNGSLKSYQENQDQIKWAYVQLSRKLTSVCLDGAIQYQNDNFQEILNKAQEFLQHDNHFVIENFEQVQFLNDQLIEGLSSIINNSCQVMIKSNTTTTTLGGGKHYKNSSEISSSTLANLSNDTLLSPIQEQTFATKLIQIEERIKEKLDIFNRLQNYLSQNSFGNLQRVDQKIAPESLWRFISTLSRFCGALKLDVGFDTLTLNQLIKSLPRSQTIQNTECSTLYRNDNLKTLMTEIEQIKIDSVTSTLLNDTIDCSFRNNDNFNSHSQAINNNKQLIEIIQQFDYKFKRVNDRLIANFIDRLIIKIRKEVSLKNAINNAIEEVDANIRDYSDNKQDGQELGLLTLLRENLELRREIYSQAGISNNNQ